MYNIAGIPIQNLNGTADMNHSYMIIDKQTNEVVIEIWNKDLLNYLKPKYTYKTALQYLKELNLITQINKM